MKKINLLKILFLICISSYSQNTITIDPENVNQSVIFGGDGKLTIKTWADNETNTVSRKLFEDMNLKILRVPIFALQKITDPLYDNVIKVINSVKSYNPEVKIFASIANGDGYGKDYHKFKKFPSKWTGCCPSNVYKLNLTAYSAYLDSFMQKMTDAGITVDYLGPYNEDEAKGSDYSKIIAQMKKLGTTEIIGVEGYAVVGSTKMVNNMVNDEDKVTIVGSHFYDDKTTLGKWESNWTKLVTASKDPVWYTESTRYNVTDGIDLLIAGMDNIFAPIRSGVEGVIFYQVCRRFVYANGDELPIKYSGFQNIVNNSEGKVIKSTSSNGKIKLVVFGDDTTLDVHIINKNTTDKTVKLQLQNNYVGNGTVTRKIWTSTATGTSSSYNIAKKASLSISVPATSYSHFKIPLDKSVLGVNDLNFNNNDKLKIFPNPSSKGQFKLTIPNNDSVEKVTIKIFSLDGKEIFSKTQNYEPTLLLNKNLLSGMYLISVKIGTTILNSKIIIPKQ